MKTTGLLLSASFTLVLSLVAGVFVLALMRMGDNQVRMQSVVEEHFVKTTLLNQMYTASRERSISLFSMVSLDDPFERDEQFLRYHSLAARFAEARLALREMNLDENEQTLLVTQGEITLEVVPVQEQVIELMQQEQLEDAAQLLLNKAVPGQNGVLALLQELLDYQQELAKRAFAEASTIYLETKRYISALFLSASSLGIAIAVFVVRKTNASERALFDANENLERRVAERTHLLSTAYQDLRNSQKQLVQSEKMASLGHLTAGIAHEIKNPLNFVNNFAETSSQLVGEVGEELAKARQSNQVVDWDEINDLLGMLETDMGSIKDHGKRIDSIVQGMLMHARGDAGEPTSTDLNTLVEQTLALAYHGERAKNRGFNTRLNTQLAADLGTVELVTQDFSRVLVNLLSNAFYATQKRLHTESSGDYEPMVEVITRAKGDNVEIDVVDNGLGIPQHLQEKLFTPFFTTKPPGEGTGLGLSMSYEIIVDQHSGQLHFESKEGEGTRFSITLPRSFVVRHAAAKETRQ